MAAAAPQPPTTIVLSELAKAVPAFRHLDESFWGFWRDFARLAGHKDERRRLVARWNASHGNHAGAFAEAAVELERVYLVACAVQLLSGGSEAAAAAVATEADVAVATPKGCNER